MLRILLIDDSPHKTADLRELLMEIGEYNPKLVHDANSVESALKYVSKTQYDLAILDLYIPNRYGDDPNPDNAVRFIRELNEFADEYKMPHNIVAITVEKDADPKYKEIFDKNLFAYILYERGCDDWKEKLKNKISFLVRAQNSLRIQDSYDYDVAIINALEAENDKVKLVFGNDGWNEIVYESDKSATFYTKTVLNYKGESVRIVTCYALQMASTASAALTTKLLYYFRPKYLFMTGIAAGVDRTEVNLGDILVAEKVWDGASGKIKTDKEGVDIFLPDYHELPLDTDVQGIVTRLSKKKKLLDEIEEGFEYVAGKPQTHLRIHLGPIASVPAVLSSKEEVAKLEAHCRKLLGIEMEGYGIFYASSNSATPRPKYTVLIKSVSDYADPNKSDDYQEYAMYTSAALAKYIILNELNYNIE